MSLRLPVRPLRQPGAHLLPARRLRAPLRLRLQVSRARPRRFGHGCCRRHFVGGCECLCGCRCFHCGSQGRTCFRRGGCRRRFDCGRQCLGRGRGFGHGCCRRFNCGSHGHTCCRRGFVWECLRGCCRCGRGGICRYFCRHTGRRRCRRCRRRPLLHGQALLRSFPCGLGGRRGKGRERRRGQNTCCLARRGHKARLRAARLRRPTLAHRAGAWGSRSASVTTGRLGRGLCGGCRFRASFVPASATAAGRAAVRVVSAATISRLRSSSGACLASGTGAATAFSLASR